MIAIAFGSNLGDRAGNIIAGANQLVADGAVKLLAISSLYETEPVGCKDQPDFLNATAIIATELPPLALLDACLAVEKQLGRVRTLRWGPRVLDIDILVYHDLQMNDERLTLPHPRLPERGFVLAPLAEIAPNTPVWQGLTVLELLTALQDDCAVRLHRKLLLQGGEIKLG
ncbi:MAG: 2-amino-4-hydroxy-6-hydroxymethyldihydropteridine diphosphokinase [Negativicutes bacterium]|nr:2-amino-4-hydroxy-6-hydroxymethyldihydropteridine diphosphokinase [Negativicutes bacterium]